NNNVFEGSYNSNFYNSYKHMFENKKEYLNNIKTLYYKNLINIGKFKNKYINTSYFRKLSKYFVENNKICSTNTDIRKQNLYNNTYKTQIEITKNLDYDFIFDKIKEMITDEMIFMCDIK
ncbi:hypothetical protein, partial [uncultured Tyzzerella sp.]|uniref:hypothetical protein n=1 Tax=uncultured Tyzzerella sp. TaxID=2321398 RepID=UPI00294380B6